MEHRPALCAGCQRRLTAAAAVVLRERRQVQELLPVWLQVTEHQALHLRCPVCQAVTAGTFSVEVPSRVQHGPRLRAGGVSGEGRALGGNVREVGPAGGARRPDPCGQYQALHARRCPPKRGAEASTDIGILPGFRGVSVQDGWKPYRVNTSCRHALCTIHHLRELTFLEEQQYHQVWANCA